jgi:glycosyltransferase involved in cell wall biosynthesis
MRAVTRRQEAGARRRSLPELMTGAPAPPRILVLSENESVPSDRRVWDVCLALRAHGCQVLVVCPQGRADEQALFEAREGIEVHRYPLRFAAGESAVDYAREYATAMWRSWRLVARLSAQRRFDAVHACNPPDFLLMAAWPARRRGARVLFDHHDLTPELLRMRFGERRLLLRLALLIERASMAFADVVISTNQSYRQIAIKRGRKRPEQVFVVRNGPDPRRVPRMPADPTLKRGRALLIGYVGVMAPQDGVDHALRALALLAHRRDWHAVFAGDGAARESLVELAGTLGLRERVELCGWLDEKQVARLLGTCDLCLAPEPSSPLNELSTMVKIAEYMGAGRPLVAYALHESRLTAGEAALYAKPDDVADFAARIEELLDDPARRAAMGRIGEQRVRDELSWEHSERALIDAYRSVLGDMGGCLARSSEPARTRARAPGQAPDPAQTPSQGPDPAPALAAEIP